MAHKRKAKAKSKAKPKTKPKAKGKKKRPMSGFRNAQKQLEALDKEGY